MALKILSEDSLSLETQELRSSEHKTPNSPKSHHSALPKKQLRAHREDNNLFNLRITRAA